LAEQRDGVALELFGTRGKPIVVAVNLRGQITVAHQFRMRQERHAAAGQEGHHGAEFALGGSWEFLKTRVAKKRLDATDARVD
jgi:hypothetical protein